MPDAVIKQETKGKNGVFAQCTQSAFFCHSLGKLSKKSHELTNCVPEFFHWFYMPQLICECCLKHEVAAEFSTLTVEINMIIPLRSSTGPLKSECNELIYFSF